jgi:hypothetical protein
MFAQQMVNGYQPQVMPQFTSGLQGYAGYGPNNMQLQAAGNFGYGMINQMQPYQMAPGGFGYEEEEEEEEPEEEPVNDGMVRMFEMMKAMLPQMANLHSDHNELELQAYEDDEKNGNFIEGSKDCPCCKGYVFNCPTDICRNLGSCHCYLRRENEGAGAASQM